MTRHAGLLHITNNPLLLSCIPKEGGHQVTLEGYRMQENFGDEKV